jgi:site-specific recombinase XerD
MPTRALEKTEIKKIFDRIDSKYAHRNQTMLICGIAMALRATELCQLHTSDVLDNNGDIKNYITIRAETAKFEKARTIRIGKKVKTALKEFIAYKKDVGESVAEAAPLFLSQKGGCMTRQQLFRVMQRIFKQAAIDQSPHALRKTGATLYYIESGYDLIATQQFLGHANPSTTREYIGLTTEELETYSERLADVLFWAIAGEDEKRDTIPNLLHFADSDLLLELKQRGYTIEPLLAEKRTQQLSAAKVISIDVARAKS